MNPIPASDRIGSAVVIPLNPKLLEYVGGRDEKDVLAAYFSLLENSKDDARVLRKHLCYQSLACFYALYLADPHEFVPFAEFHFEMLGALPRGMQGAKLNILAPRGAAKSMLVSITSVSYTHLTLPTKRIV